MADLFSINYFLTTKEKKSFPGRFTDTSFGFCDVVYDIYHQFTWLLLGRAAKAKQLQASKGCFFCLPDVGPRKHCNTKKFQHGNVTTLTCSRRSEKPYTIFCRTVSTSLVATPCRRLCPCTQTWTRKIHYNYVAHTSIQLSFGKMHNCGTRQTCDETWHKISVRPFGNRVVVRLLWQPQAPKPP